VLALLSAAFGLWYNAMTFSTIYSDVAIESNVTEPTPFFRQAFYVMSAICVACYLALAWCGVQFLRLSTMWWWLFAVIGTVELLFLPVVGRLWLHPEWGMSIGAASGVASGGLVPQLLVLFPIWGPFAVWFARRSLRPT
jgi:hypothetical protein